MKSSYIRWFEEVRKGDIAVVGGKGASLGELYANHISVPNGFCITAQAYAYFLLAEGLQDTIRELLAPLDPENTAKLEKVSHTIQDLILKQKFPLDLREQIDAAYNVLTEDGNPFVAVRSSATAEDLPEASFAGQQDTFLNIQGIDYVYRYVQRCFASLFTARAIYYRSRHHFDHNQVLISVVIQKMIDARKAGVMFTANPINNSRDEMVIEGAFGLGEAVVSGSLTPDTYILRKTNAKILQKHISIQEWGLFRNPITGITEEQPVPHGQEEVLTGDELQELCALGRQIEEHYGSPQDIEWAIYDKVYVLQSRPITTLK